MSVSCGNKTTDSRMSSGLTRVIFHSSYIFRLHRVTLNSRKPVWKLVPNPLRKINPKVGQLVLLPTGKCLANHAVSIPVITHEEQDCVGEIQTFQEVQVRVISKLRCVEVPMSEVRQPRIDEHGSMVSRRHG